jgi:hypothetical protein
LGQLDHGEHLPSPLPDAAVADVATPADNQDLRLRIPVPRVLAVL